MWTPAVRFGGKPTNNELWNHYLESALRKFITNNNNNKTYPYFEKINLNMFGHWKPILYVV